MKQLDWENIQSLANQKASLLTKTRVSFRIVAASDETLTIQVRSGQEHTISRSNLEKAVAKIQSGTILNGPNDYRNLIADDRPAYAWSILRELGFIE